MKIKARVACDYCKLGERAYQSIGDITLWIINSGIGTFLRAEHYEGKASTSSYFRINYCPNCGRKLR